MDDVELARALLGAGAGDLNLDAAPQWAQRYAARWLRGVAAELLHELREGCGDAVRVATRAAEVSRSASAAAQARARAGTLRLTVAEHAASGGTGGGPCTAFADVSPLDGGGRDDDDDEGDGGGDFRPPRSHTLLFAQSHGLLFLWRGGGASRRGRVVAWARSADGDQLRAVEPPPAGAAFEVCEVASARTAVTRARTVTSVASRLRPTLAALLVPGAPQPQQQPQQQQSSSTVPQHSAAHPWMRVGTADLMGSSASRSSGGGLNPSQAAAVAGLHGGGAVGVVQGPPGTGKSALIAQVVVSCVPAGARVLACTATNQAIDSLVAKLEAAGVVELLCVGSAEAMGAAARRHTVTARLLRDPVVAGGDQALVAACNAREVAEQALAALAKPGGGASKRGADGREVNRGFVERAMGKLDAGDPRPLKRTPGWGSAGRPPCFDPGRTPLGLNA